MKHVIMLSLSSMCSFFAQLMDCSFRVEYTDNVSCANFFFTNQNEAHFRMRLPTQCMYKCVYKCAIIIAASPVKNNAEEKGQTVAFRLQNSLSGRVTFFWVGEICYVHLVPLPLLLATDKVLDEYFW